eukprot:CAMPEP_0168354056 /NCGR_PEP_ID=MMETSP0213-20121227/23648_1 /TAXON_ID=151035 /ORGANISM="Euplotes harpa, Strain FSP1.4" /LENGTH=76 /DNA_ID=CAMNT_0008365843 /DNA_START=301 /DNA_END=527 /DNA_ORIENTATION=+
MVNGHAFAAGFYLALCQMRGDRGYLCFNEMAFGAAACYHNVVMGKDKMDTRVYQQLYTEAKKIDAEEAFLKGIVYT